MVVRDAETKTVSWADITGAVVAAVAALGNLVGAFVIARAFFDDRGLLDDSLAGFTVLGALVLAAVLGYSAVLHARGDETGRWILFVAAIVQIALGILGLLACLLNYDPGYGIHWFERASDLRAILDAGTFLPGAVTALVTHSWLGALAALVLGAVMGAATVRLTPTARVSTVDAKPSGVTHPENLVGPAV
ncbi:hypothetical protein [Nocardia lasii]|uniref:Uncharacterized protein n=1 Tax=Nocardia lasii TaxID=1616107 RepID=A0ABW1JTJ8_9NOCA